jgi:hypothetical protein
MDVIAAVLDGDTTWCHHGVMQLDRYAERLRSQLAAVAEAGTPEAQALAERMSTALDAAVRITILEALAEAAVDISRDLAPGSVDVRLRGQDPELVVNRAPEAVAPAPAAQPRIDAGEDEPSTFRTTLRLPERLKTRVEEAASADGISVNTWLVRTVSAALDAERPRTPPQNGNRFTGWVR